MTVITEVPSPFCGVGTDDLAAQVDGIAIKVTANGCVVNTPAFEQAIGDTSSRIAGKTVSFQEAVIKAAALLAETKQPVIGGCATDVNGMRALLSLADCTGAVVDNMGFNSARNNLLTLQDSGWMNTTLAEVKNRCDLLLVLGTDIEAVVPRFFEHYLWNEAMFLENSSQRQVIYLGKAPSGNAATSPDGQKAQVLACDDSALPDVVGVLRALVKGQPIRAEKAGGIAVADLQSIADKLKAAKYGVVTWGAGALGVGTHAELIVQTVSEMIKDINDKGARCSGLPLAGKDGDLTANQVCGWTTGYPARVSFARGYPEYDPFLYDTNLMLANGEADALVWVNAFNAKAVPPESELPTIVIGRSGMIFNKEPDVLIPVGTPGIDHAGHAYRTDNVVAIRLKKLRYSGLPSTAEVLTAIEVALKEVKHVD
ncbi:MAG: formylmethanofuran dehydrogenase subunit B [Proteobacteria bacterium]|nr:formylmethanofuran dehydrogenase subunit B [Pseudomonadota bacterium]